MSDLITMMAGAAGYAASQTGGYQISRSLRFNSDDSAHLNRTPASAGNRKTWTWSGWVKRSALSSTHMLFSAGNASDSTYFLFFITGGTNQLQVIAANGGTTKANIIADPLLRDVSAWYHVVLALDASNATSADRLKFYLNGVLQSVSASTTVANENLEINNTVTHRIGRDVRSTYTTNYFSGYMTEIHFVDGQALTPSSFGETDETTGVWKPKAYAGTYGTNGFYLNFSDNTSTTTLGEDQAGSNDWTLNNFSVTAGAGNDSLVDTPTPYGTDTGAGGEVRGNYAVLNPIDSNGATYSNGNLQVAGAGTGTNRNARSTLGSSTGKWYWEWYVSTAGTVNNQIHFGCGAFQSPISSAGLGPAYIRQNGTGAGTVLSGSYFSFTTGDYVSVAFDADNGTVEFKKNGTAGSIKFDIGSISEAYFPFLLAGDTGVIIANFGQRPFAYTAPSGFKALCTQNLPTPTVVQGDDYFNTLLWTGDATAKSITGLDFQPDLVWYKERSSTSSHAIVDAVRGQTNAARVIYPDRTDAEAIANSTQSVTSLNSDGFSIGTDASINESGQTYVAWNWNAGGSTATNTDGTITTTVRANPTAGFSIVSYTGTGSAATVGHGLGAAPAMIIVKNRDQADAWQVYHKANTANPETDYLVLNTNAITVDAADRWNDTAPTSTVFSIGNGVEVNTNTEDYIAYCFAEVPGYSAFGSYTGNGSADGPFVYTGFRPAFVMRKRTDTTGSWIIQDDKRIGYNAAPTYLSVLYANETVAETIYNEIDILSNGFKCRATESFGNASGGTYIWFALAENPFKYSLAR